MIFFVVVGVMLISSSVEARGVGACFVRPDDGNGYVEAEWLSLKDPDVSASEIVKSIKEEIKEKRGEKVKLSCRGSYGSEFKKKGGYYVLIKSTFKKGPNYYGLGYSLPGIDARQKALKRAKSSLTADAFMLRIGKNDDQYVIVGEGKF